MLLVTICWNGRQRAGNVKNFILSQRVALLFLNSPNPIYNLQLVGFVFSRHTHLHQRDQYI